MALRKYSLRLDGDRYIFPHFKGREFACHDGSDIFYVDDALGDLLEKIRAHFGGATVALNSSYRNESYNRKIGGASGSQHTLGKAADIVVRGFTPTEVAEAAEYFLGNTGGIGLYTASKFTHVDVRKTPSRWYEKKNGTTAVRGRFDTGSVLKRLEANKEMVETSKVIVNGKEVPVQRILKDGTNFVKIRDIANALNMDISSNGSIPVLKSK